LASNRIDVNSGIKKLKIPFIVASFCLFVLEVIVNILRCLPLGLTNTMLFVDGAIYTAVGLSIGVFYVVTAVRVVRRVKNSERMKDRFTARVSYNDNNGPDLTPITRALKKSQPKLIYNFRFRYALDLLLSVCSSLRYPRHSPYSCYSSQKATCLTFGWATQHSTRYLCAIFWPSLCLHHFNRPPKERTALLIQQQTLICSIIVKICSC
jgi:hypothetical protein